MAPPVAGAAAGGTTPAPPLTPSRPLHNPTPPPAAGSAISSGVFVPMLLIGACIGRLVGLIGVDIAAARGLGSEG